MQPRTEAKHVWTMPRQRKGRMKSNEEKRLQRRQRLMDNRAYQTMQGLTRYMDRYYLDALIGVIPGWGDAIALICVVPFVYFSSRVIKSVPLTLAVLNNALRDVLLGMIPFFVGDIIDIFHRANTQNMQPNHEGNKQEKKDKNNG